MIIKIGKIEHNLIHPTIFYRHYIIDDIDGGFFLRHCIVEASDIHEDGRLTPEIRALMRERFQEFFEIDKYSVRSQRQIDKYRLVWQRKIDKWISQVELLSKQAKQLEQFILAQLSQTTMLPLAARFYNDCLAIFDQDVPCASAIRINILRKFVAQQKPGFFAPVGYRFHAFGVFLKSLIFCHSWQEAKQSYNEVLDGYYQKAAEIQRMLTLDHRLNYFTGLFSNAIGLYREKFEKACDDRAYLDSLVSATEVCKKRKYTLTEMEAIPDFFDQDRLLSDPDFDKRSLHIGEYKKSVELALGRTDIDFTPQVKVAVTAMRWGIGSIIFNIYREISSQLREDPDLPDSVKDQLAQCLSAPEVCFSQIRDLFIDFLCKNATYQVELHKKEEPLTIQTSPRINNPSVRIQYAGTPYAFHQPVTAASVTGKDFTLQ